MNKIILLILSAISVFCASYAQNEADNNHSEIAVIRTDTIKKRGREIRFDQQKQNNELSPVQNEVEDIPDITENISVQNSDKHVYSDMYETYEVEVKNFGSLELPPLKLLLRNARRSSIMEYYDAKLVEEMTSLEIEKRAWLKYIKLEGSYKYGTSGFAGEGNDPIFKFSGGAQNLYSLGLTVSIPLDDLFSRDLKHKRQSMRVREIEVDLDKAYDELKIVIIESYSAASKMLNVMDLKMDILLLANMSYKDVEKDYRQGRATLQELKSAKQQQIVAKQDHDDVWLTLNSIILKLEILTRTQIISE